MIIIPKNLHVLSIHNELISVKELPTFDSVFYGKSLVIDDTATFPFTWSGCEIITNENTEGLKTFINIEFGDIYLTIPTHMKVLTLKNNKPIWRSAASLNSTDLVSVFIFHSLITTLNPTKITTLDEDIDEVTCIGTRGNKPMFLGKKDSRYKNYNLSLVTLPT